MITYNLPNNNKIIVQNGVILNDELNIIKFNGGGGNTLIVNNFDNIKHSNVTFFGNNSTVYIAETKKKYKIVIRIYTNSLLYIGKNCFFNDFNNQKVIFFVYEHQNIIIGDGCLVSYGVTFRTADPHLVYDVDSGKRINRSRSILIGDHVWIGQGSLILKGTKVGSGSIIGGGSVVSGKKIPSNQAWAGNPARLVRKGVFWERPATNGWDEEMTVQKSTSTNKMFIYSKDDASPSLVDMIDDISFEQILISPRNKFFIPDIDNT